MKFEHGRIEAVMEMNGDPFISCLKCSESIPVQGWVGKEGSAVVIQ